MRFPNISFMLTNTTEFDFIVLSGRREFIYVNIFHALNIFVHLVILVRVCVFIITSIRLRCLLNEEFLLKFNIFLYCYEYLNIIKCIPYQRRLTINSAIFIILVSFTMDAYVHSSILRNACNFTNILILQQYYMQPTLI